MKLNRVILHGGVRPADETHYGNGTHTLRIVVKNIYTGSRLELQVHDPNDNDNLRDIVNPETGDTYFMNPKEIVEALIHDFGTSTNSNSAWVALAVVREGVAIGTLSQIRERMRREGGGDVQEESSRIDTEAAGGNDEGDVRHEGDPTEPTGGAAEDTEESTKQTDGAEQQATVTAPATKQEEKEKEVEVENEEKAEAEEEEEKTSALGHPLPAPPASPPPSPPQPPTKQWH